MIYERLVDIIKNYTEVPPENIRPESGLREFGLTSFDILNIVFDCENEFGITIPDSDIRTLQTLNDIIAYLEMRQNAPDDAGK